MRLKWLGQLNHAFRAKFADDSALGMKSAQVVWQRRLRYIYYRFVRLQGSPDAIARGLAMGVLAGCFPLFGLQTLIGIGLAAVVRGNKLMAAAGTWISNPLTYFPIFAFNFKVGQWLLGPASEPVSFEGLQSWQEMMAMGADLVIALFLGSFVVGVFCSALSYFLGIWGFQWIRQRRSRSD